MEGGKYGSLSTAPSAPAMEMVPPGQPDSTLGMAYHGADPLVTQLPVELEALLVQPSATTVPYSPDYLCSASNCILGLITLPFGGCGAHRLVPQGQLATVWDGDLPFFIGPGRHCLWKPTLRCSTPMSENAPYIQHGPIHLIRVSMGQLGMAEVAGSGPRLFPPGFHMVESSVLTWVGAIDFKEQVTQVGNLTVVRVETGNVGYKYQKAELVVIEPGLHVISPPDRFGGFLSTQQQILSMPEAVHESSDYVPLCVKADIYYRVVHPYRCLTEVKDLDDSLQEIGMATLAGIIRASSLSDIASSSLPSHSSETGSVDVSNPPHYQSDAAAMGGKKETFYQHVHDEFLGNLQDHLLKSWGVDISNIRVEYLKIRDASLAAKISEAAIDACAKDTKYLL
eukprot:TRINITY_DN37626_c0_g1_i1.p1 TRINITY_DN37626_c0_g1~~TRINITY_DN37626_c0_g1_i1.p1  ORF type:complete len:396 (-),score=79.72 TRINITY_DN37626_c0_g1_i1:508-1695(-)